MTRLTLVRHAEQVRDPEAGDDPGLSARGRRQAELLAARLGAGEPPDVLVTSAYRRTRETAAVLEGSLGRVAIRVPELGEFRLLPAGAPRRADAARAWEVARRDLDAPAGGGAESVRGFHARVTAAIDALVEAYRGRHVLAVVHGGVIKVAFFHLLGFTLEQAVEVYLGIDHTGIFRFAEVELGGARRWKLAGANDLAHLAGMSGP